MSVRTDRAPKTAATLGAAASGRLTPAQTGLDDAARAARPFYRYALAAVALMMVSFTTTIVFGLPEVNFSHIEAAFPGPQTIWAQTLVTAVGAVTTLPLGKLGDVYGKKRILLIQLLCVLAGSVLSASTHSFALLLVGSALQGFSVSGLVLVYSLIRDLFPRNAIPFVIGLNAGAFGIGSGVGDLLGGWLAPRYAYTMLFWAIAAGTATTLVLVALLVPETPLRTPDKLDWPGIGMVSAGLFAVVYGLNEASVPGRGWGSMWMYGFTGFGVLVVALWVVYERSRERQTAGSRLLTSREVGTTLVTAVLFGIALLGVQFLVVTIEETPHVPGLGYGLGLSETGVGLESLPGCAIGILAALIAGWSARRVGARRPLLIGLAAMIAAAVAEAFLTTQTWLAITTISLEEVGLSVSLVALPLLIIEAVQAHYQGISAGMNQIGLTIGGAVSTQLVVVILARHTFLTDPATGASISTHSGIQFAAVVMAGVGVLALGAAFLIPHGRTATSGGALPDATFRTATSPSATPLGAPAFQAPSRRPSSPVGSSAR